MKLVIVTACPSGVANTVIAAGLLEKAVGERGWQATIECQSSIKAPTPVSSEAIADAERILLVGSPAQTARFNGKPVYQASLSDVMDNAQAVLDAVSFHAEVYQASEEPEANQSMRIVGITACPTGVAHTFMAAEAIEEAAKAKGYSVKIETRGSVGAKNALTDQEIADADVVFIAADIEVDLSRFDGKRLYRTSTGVALKKAAQSLDDAVANAEVYHAAKKHTNGQATASQGERTGVYKHLMTGVSHMLPLVVAGGLAIALSFVFGIEAFKEEGTLAAALMQIGGGSAFALMVPVLAGFIAFSIADRPGLAPGLIGGMLAASTGAGFLGGILAGFIAGYSAKFVADKVQLPATMEALKPILVIPLVASLFTGLVMIYVVGGPISVAMDSLTTFLQGMNSTNAVILGVLLGAMMCFDLGGPVNKAAYTFGVGLIDSGTYMPMAAIMAAGMVPALGMGLATFLAKRKFNDAEQEAGKASFVLGLCFISEGAIPFAAKDPMRVIPACIAGGALTGAISMLIGAKLMAPHGGLFVLLIPNAITPVFMYLAAIAAGTLVTGIVYALIKPVSQPSPLTAAKQS